MQGSGDKKRVVVPHHCIKSTPTVQQRNHVPGQQYQLAALTAKHINEVFSSLDLNNKDVHQSKVRSHTTQHNNCKPIPRDPQITFKTPNTTDSAQHLQAFIPSQAHKRQRDRSGTSLLPGSPGTPSYPAYIVSYTTCLQIPASNLFN